MKSMRLPLAIIGAFFLVGFGALIFLWTSKDDETHFADQLMDYTDVTVPEMNKITVSYQGRDYEITGWDVDDIYTVINRGDGVYRTRLFFNKEPGKDVIRLQFGDTADIYISKDEDKPKEDIAIMKYKDLENNRTRYYKVEDLAMFEHILKIVNPVKKK